MFPHLGAPLEHIRNAISADILVIWTLLQWLGWWILIIVRGISHAFTFGSCTKRWPIFSRIDRITRADIKPAIWEMRFKRSTASTGEQTIAKKEIRHVFLNNADTNLWLVFGLWGFNRVPVIWRQCSPEPECERTSSWQQNTGIFLPKRYTNPEPAAPGRRTTAFWEVCTQDAAAHLGLKAFLSAYSLKWLTCANYYMKITKLHKWNENSLK